MKTIYMIDFENTGSAGLTGCKNLTDEDTVMIFFTQNCIRIDMRTLNGSKANIRFVEIPAGNQSLDMHISSYIGYYSCKNKEDGCNMVVISKDRGYEAVIGHWTSDKIKIAGSVSVEAFLTGENPTEAAETAEVQQAPVKQKRKKRPAKKNKADKKNAEEKTDKKKKKEEESSEDTAVMQPAKESEEKENVSKEAEAAIQDAEKPIETESLAAASAPPEVSPKMENNNQIMQTLSKAGLPQKTVGELSSICAKNYGLKNRKQLTYRAFVSALGQKQGIEVYRQIKSLLG